MIQSLLSAFKTYPDSFCLISKTGKKNIHINNNLQFYYGQIFLMILTTGWILFQLNNYSHLSSRLKDLFSPTTFFGKVLMPFFPSPFLYYTVGILSILFIVYMLIKKDYWWLKLAVMFSLLWLNLLERSWGKLNHVSHVLILSHLLSIFVPIHAINHDKANAYISKSIEWVYLGILMIYFYSGMWKWIGLAYKIVAKSEDIHWLHPKAVLYNTLIHFRIYDKPYDHMVKYFEYPLFWQISFLTMSLILTLSLFAAFRPPLRPWAGLAIIIFHLVNYLVFNIGFFTAPLVIASLFFSYNLFFNNFTKSLFPIAETSFTGKRGNAIYTRKYQNGEQDQFYGFYAYRERVTDKNILIGGLLYIPFLDLLPNIVWNRQSNIILQKK